MLGVCREPCGSSFRMAHMDNEPRGSIIENFLAYLIKMLLFLFCSRWSWRDRLDNAGSGLAF